MYLVTTIVVFLGALYPNQNTYINFLMNFAEAAQVRKEYDESSGKLSKIQSRISSLKQKLKQDFGIPKIRRKIFLIIILITLVCTCISFLYLHFIIAGPEKEFYSFYGQCFESKENKYEIS